MRTDLDEDRLLNREEVQDRFGLTKRFLETLPPGEGPRRVRIGRLIRYRVSDIRRWILQQTEDDHAK